MVLVSSDIYAILPAADFVAIFAVMNQPVNLILPHNIKLTVKREDLLHPHISGNKFRKLKYNILQAKADGHHTLLTFGGAFSNHIAATAAAGKEYGIKTIGIIRGEELFDKVVENPTLSFAKQCGMELIFVSRDDYNRKTEEAFIEKLGAGHGNFYLVPEGGTNELAVKGCEEILTPDDQKFTHIACAVGTGGTIAGLAKSEGKHQQILGFPALKADLSDDISKFAPLQNIRLVTDYHFGGYAKVTEELVQFMNSFYVKTGILLDPVYTGKVVFGVIDMANKGELPDNADILLIHTGGLQGIAGMNIKLKNKGLPLLKTKMHD